jgi:hypothetical protein
MQITKTGIDRSQQASGQGKPAQRFSPEEMQAHQDIAKELGYASPKALGDAIRNNTELRDQVNSMLQEKGITPQEGKPAQIFSRQERQAHKEIAKELGFDNPRALGDALRKNPELRKEVASLMKEKGFAPKAGPGMKPPPPPKAESLTDSSSSEASSVETAAVAHGFGAKESPDVDGYLTALKKGDITGYQSPTGNLVNLAA